MSKISFDVRVEKAVVVLTLRGLLDFEETGQALAAAAEAARESRSTKALFDLRLADISNYYSYAVRHAEAAPEFGLDLESFRLAFLGAREASDVLSFMVTISRNRGWSARDFTDWEAAMKWLTAEGPHTNN